MVPQSNMRSTPCSAVEADLVLLHYGDLGGAELDNLKVHVGVCAGCAGYLAELAKLMPLTVKTDEPPQMFWSDYNRELRRKLEDSAASQSWRRTFAQFFQPRWLPAFAAAAVVALALTFTLGKGIWPTQTPVPDDEAILEALPLAENLEFFKAMDFLDDLELLELLGSQDRSRV
ncbi:MAG TPA: hypothetical protein VMR20_15330 [Verrucomicrobiae bacterium]|nr:hypothetical protein [Verrucomicrobiae bacterium]